MDADMIDWSQASQRLSYFNDVCTQRMSFCGWKTCRSEHNSTARNTPGVPYDLSEYGSAYIAVRNSPLVRTPKLRDTDCGKVSACDLSVVTPERLLALLTSPESQERATKTCAIGLSLLLRPDFMSIQSEMPLTGSRDV